MKILTVRMDRLGDVLLSLPAIEFLKRALPDAQHFFALSQMVYPAVRPFLDEIGIKAVVTTSESIRPFLINNRVDAILILNAPGAVYREAYSSRVPFRFGMRSSVPSLLFLNGGVRQRRSKADRSEGVFNGELAEAFLKKLEPSRAVRFADEYSAITIPSDLADVEMAHLVLKELDLPAKFAVVHPGMGGSALNLSVEKYQELLVFFQKSFQFPLVFSKGPAPSDQTLVDDLTLRFPDAKTFPAVSLGVLRELFRLAQIVVAPSTGPLHLAHYVGTATLGLFSPVRSHRPLRWQPWGGEGRSLVLTPEVDCPGTKECLGGRCAAYPCMEKAQWDLLLGKAGDFI